MVFASSLEEFKDVKKFKLQDSEWIKVEQFIAILRVLFSFASASFSVLILN